MIYLLKIIDFMPETRAETPDPIDKGLERMRIAIEPTPARRAELASAQAHLEELKSARSNIDQLQGLEAVARAKEISATNQVEKDRLTQELSDAESRLSELTQEMRKLGDQLMKYMSREEAVLYITGAKQIGASKKLGGLLWGKTANANFLIEKLQPIHQEMQTIKKKKNELLIALGRQETKLEMFN